MSRVAFIDTVLALYDRKPWPFRDIDRSSLSSQLHATAPLPLGHCKRLVSLLDMAKDMDVSTVHALQDALLGHVDFDSLAYRYPNNAAALVRLLGRDRSTEYLSALPRTDRLVTTLRRQIKIVTSCIYNPEFFHEMPANERAWTAMAAALAPFRGRFEPYETFVRAGAAGLLQRDGEGICYVAKIMGWPSDVTMVDLPPLLTLYEKSKDDALRASLQHAIEAKFVTGGFIAQQSPEQRSMTLKALSKSRGRSGLSTKIRETLLKPSTAAPAPGTLD